MSEILKEKDKRGITFTCSESQWRNHIVSGHSMMADNLDAVAETVRNPDYIYESHASNPPLDYREVISKEVPYATYYSNKLRYTTVVASVLGGNAEIITAYPSKKPQGGARGEPIFCAENEDQLR